MSKDNGGAAFARPESKVGSFADSRIEHAQSGMTLRDYFAAKAMQGICMHPDTWGLIDVEITKRSYDIADAMLEARAK